MDVATAQARWTRLVGIALSFLLGVFAASPPGANGAVGDCAFGAGWAAPDRALAGQVIALVNQHRAALGLAQVAVSPTLSAAAEWKSGHMNALGYLGHGDLDYPVVGQLRSPGERIAACLYPNPGWGENVAYGQRSPQEVMNVWLASPGHRANIEGATFRTIGVGVTPKLNSFFWTQDFGPVSDAGAAPPPGAWAAPPPSMAQPSKPSAAGPPPAASQPSSAAVTAGALRVSKVSVRWRALKSGTTLPAELVALEAGPTPTQGLSLTCRAKVSRRALRVVRRQLTRTPNGVLARCAWRVPHWTSGQRLQGAVTVGYVGGAANGKVAARLPRVIG